MAEVNGRIVAKEGKKVWILLDQDTNDYEVDNAMLLGYDKVSLYVDDNVTVTNAQRKFAYAVIGEIFDAQIGGYHKYDSDGWLVTIEAVEQHFKYVYFMRYGERISLSRATGRKYDANNFIDILMEFVTDNGISIKNYRPLDYLQGKAAYNHCYRSIMVKRCAVCGKPGDFHHINKIQSGNNRKKVNHLGRYAAELCRTHHGELDSYGMDEKMFFDKYHLVPVKVDELIAAKHGLNTDGKEDYRLTGEFVNKYGE